MCKLKESKQTLFIPVGLFLFFYLLNYLMPMAFGDDYLYAFIWQGNPMFVPLTEDAVRLSSLGDLLESQQSFYFTWSGRVINNTLAQLFAWAGKGVFNICNAIVATLLVMELYWCANKGEISFSFKVSLLCWLFFMFWTFSPRFPSVVFWLVGAFHYLWPAVFITGFLIPYIRKYYCFQDVIAPNSWFACVMFLFGILSGCTNENSVCWVIFILTVFIYFNRQKREMEFWVYSGFAGLVIGYALLMFAPGNYVRLHSVHGYDWFTAKRFLDNLHVFVQVIIWQFILWYFCLRSLFILKRLTKVCDKVQREKLKKDILLIQVFCVTAMGMSAIMLLSPEFHLRSGFPGTVQLIIAVGILLRIQNEYNIELLQQNVKHFLTCVGVVFFVVSAGVTLRHLNEHRLWNLNLMSHVTALQMRLKEKETVLYAEPLITTGRLEDFMSGFHTFENNLSDDENSWENVSFSRYYGIKGIRMLHPEKTVSEKK